jgi:hypothetical protein
MDLPPVEAPTAGEAAPGVFLPLVQRVETDLSIAEVKIIQGTSASGAFSVNVAGRDTDVRVFVGTGNGKNVAGVTARLCAFDSEAVPLGCIDPVNAPVSAPSREENLASTLNFHLPSGWLNTGYTFYVDLDPDRTVTDRNRANNRYPAQGTRSFDFVPAPSLNLTIIPIEYWPYGSEQAYLPQTDDLSYLTYLPEKVFPVPEVNISDHLHYTYRAREERYNLNNAEGYGWVELLSELMALHFMEDREGNRNYYGVVNSYTAHGCGIGCITGIGYLGAYNAYHTAAGWSGWTDGSSVAAETMVHELGHNFGRGHVNCSGRESNPDANYPYPGGAIGQYGLDLASGQLYDPHHYADFMSYCDPTWTSDYTYWNIYHYRHSMAVQSPEPAAPEQAVFVSGVISPDGEISLRPVYRQTVALAKRPDGPYTLQLIGEDGRMLASYPFAALEIPEAPGFRGFGFFVPDAAGLSGLRVVSGGLAVAEKWVGEALDTRRWQSEGLAVEQAEQGTSFSWAPVSHPSSQVVYRVRVSLDGGKTWQVLAINAVETKVSVSGVDLSGAWVEVQASDGVHTSTRLFKPIP